MKRAPPAPGMLWTAILATALALIAWSGGAAAQCGNDIVDGGEVCDGTDLAGQYCQLLGLPDGELACQPDCSAFDTSGCIDCGDGVRNGDEACDGPDNGGATCESLGFAGGWLGCLPDCTDFDTSDCSVCGDGVAGEGELCDGEDLSDMNCPGQGFDSGTLACLPDCSDFDTSGCTSCGDGVIEGAEACDGDNVGGETCESQGFDSGDLGCHPTCGEFDTRFCTACGNGVTEHPTEVCDGADGVEEACLAHGFDGGDAICLADCSGFDLSGCTGEGPECGNGILEGTMEVCDLDNLAGQTCESQGFGPGELACLDDCSGFDTSGCTYPWECGDGVAEGPEACDGADLGGQICEGLGFVGGSLACLPDCTDLDIAACEASELCGNHELDDGETCDPPQSCPRDCHSPDACRPGVIAGRAEACTAECVYAEIGTCVDGDHCCPEGCDHDTDTDCEGGGDNGGGDNGGGDDGGGGTCACRAAGQPQQGLLWLSAFAAVVALTLLRLSTARSAR